MNQDTAPQGLIPSLEAVELGVEVEARAFARRRLHKPERRPRTLRGLCGEIELT